MNFLYCWHRPGKLFPLRNFRVCRHCGVPVEECPCVDYGRSAKSDCPCCEGSGWVGIIRSKLRVCVRNPPKFRVIAHAPLRKSLK